MTSFARHRAWAPPSRRRLPVAALTAALALVAATVAPSAPGAAAGPGMTWGGVGPGMPGGGVGPGGTPLPAVQADGDTLRVVLDEVDPVVLQPGRPARLSGRIVNPAPTPARLGGVTVTASTSLLGSRKEVADWVDGGIDRTTAWVLGDDTVGPLVPAQGAVDFSVTVPADALGSLPDGPAALAVRVTAGVEGDGAPAGAGDALGEGHLAELRTVLTSAGDQQVDTPLEVAWVVPLTLPADPGLTDPDPAVHALAWTRAVGEGSAVDGWLGGPTLPDVTWVVDPALLVGHRPQPSVAAVVPDPEGQDDTDDPTGDPTGEETGDPTTDGPTTTDGSSATRPPDQEGSTAPAAPPDDAAGTTGPAPPPDEQAPDDGPPDDEDVAQALSRVHDRLGQVPEESRWWLPAGDPDLARLIADGLTPPPDTVGSLLTGGLPEEVPAPVVRLLGGGRSGVLWPALAGPTTPDLHRMLGLYDAAPATPTPEVVVVPRESFTASTSAGPRRGAVPVDGTGLVAVGADSWTTALVATTPAAAEEAGAGAATQRLLAHTLGIWLEGPTSSRELVVAPPRGTAPAPEVLEQLDGAWPDADWLTTVPLEQVVTRAQDREAVSLSGTAPQESVLGHLTSVLLPSDTPVDAGRGRHLVNLEDDLDGIAEILRDTRALRSWRPVLTGLWSTRWREDPRGWPTTSRVLSTDVRQAREGVHIAPSNVNFIADQGIIQVTVVNDLPVAVDEVQLAVTTTNGRLQVLRQPDPISIGPGSRAAVPFEARAVTRGEVTLFVELTTPSGTELGVDEQIAVRVQPTGVWIYWVLGGLAGVVLVLGLARALPGSSRAARQGGTSGTAYPVPGPDGPTDPGQEERQ